MKHIKPYLVGPNSLVCTSNHSELSVGFITTRTFPPPKVSTKTYFYWFIDWCIWYLYIAHQSCKVALYQSWKVTYYLSGKLINQLLSIAIQTNVLFKVVLIFEHYITRNCIYINICAHLHQFIIDLLWIKIIICKVTEILYIPKNKIPQ